jgi:hypothetical protein
MSGFFSFLYELLALNKILSFTFFSHPKLFLSKGKVGLGELSFFDLSTQFPTLVRDPLGTTPK